MDVISARRKIFNRQIRGLAFCKFLHFGRFSLNPKQYYGLRIRPNQNGRALIFDLRCNL